MSDYSYHLTRRLAVSISITAVLSILTLSLLYSGFPFLGSLNDLINAAGALISAMLAWQFYGMLRDYAPRSAPIFLLAAWAGALSIFASSVLVAFGQLDWMAGGMYLVIGYSLVGIWLLAVNQIVLPRIGNAAALSRLGTVAAVAMLIGLPAGPMLANGVNFTQNALVMAAYIGAAFGWLLFPLWTWLLSRYLL